MTKPILSRVLLAGFAALAFLFIQAAPASSNGETTGGILVFAAHPDDDVLIAAGIANQATGNITIAYMTNGDYCTIERDPYCTIANGRVDPNIAAVRQAEAVAAQAILGPVENQLFFLGYPDGFLGNLNSPDLTLTETYASRGHGGTDWYDHRMPGTAKASYTQANMQADVTALIETYRPDDIFTHSRFDRHVDHKKTYLLVVQAVADVQASDPTYDPYIHSAIVHTQSAPWSTWPDMSWTSPNWPGAAIANGPMLNAQNCAEGWPECDSSGELVWDQRETYVVPTTMQDTNTASNIKAQAVAAHASQLAFGEFIRRFIRQDEVFWIERLGSAEARADTEYSVDEGATLNVSASGVLRNDVRGVGTSPLGPLAAVLVTDVSNGTLTLNSDGSFTYTHDGSETLSDSFTYRAVQGSTQGSVATVSLTVNPVDDDPTAAVDGPYAVDNAALLTVVAPGVLGNDSDPEALSLTAVLVDDVTNGMLLLNSDGSFTYTHNGSATTTDSFTYRAQDPGGNLSGTVTVSIDVAPALTPISVTLDGPTFAAPGVAISFTTTVSDGAGALTYAWSVKRSGIEVATGSESSIDYIPSVGGAYSVTVTVIDDTGTDVAQANFTVLGDIGGNGFVNNILWLAEAGITKGCNPPTNDEFCPDDSVTRGQMAAFLVRFLGLTDGGGNSFIDDDASMFEADIAKLAAAGITKSCNPPTNDRFCPNDSVTRGQMAAFMVRALVLTDDGGGNSFVDDDGSPFEADIAKLAAAGITQGCNPPTNDRFCPNDSVTRGQMAAFLNRAANISTP